MYTGYVNTLKSEQDTLTVNAGMAEQKSDGDDSDRESEADDRDVDADRISRFVETEENPEMFKSKSLNNLKPFYNGMILDDRMAEIRKSIYYIRQHWDEFDSFLLSAKQLLLENGSLEFKDKTTKKHAERLFETKRDWMTPETVKDEVIEYEAIKLYTSKEGHARIYRVCNDIFRHAESVTSPEMIRSVVFLVELINIDLFNYCLKCPERYNFQGVVYRGLCVTPEDLDAFRRLREEPLNKRNVSVPLGLLSSSSSLKVARKFIKYQLDHQDKNGPQLTPLMFKIHVIGLSQEYRDHYTNRFPAAVLTTMCAVDIHRLSRHPKEKEVLLRGPFMLVLDIYEDAGEILGRPCHVLEAVMLNDNRDHISTSYLGNHDTLARDMFTAMVTVTRSEFAAQYCSEKGLSQDESEYRRILQDSKDKLNSLMKH